MQLETKRLVVRSLQAADAESLAHLWTDPDVTRYMGGPRDFEALRVSFTEDAQLDPPPPYDLWPVQEKSTGTVVGHCGLLDKTVDGQTEFELVYVFAVSAWGQGYATEAASAVKRYAFEQLGLKRVIALIDPKNAASERVATKVGLHFEKETLRPGGKTMRLYAAGVVP